MIRSILICTGALVLISCGGGGKSALVDSCMDEGESKEDCKCMADVLQQNLSPKAFSAVVLNAQGKDKEAEQAMQDLGMTEALAVAGAMVKVVTECGVSGFGG